jgi:hypothetical protein
MTYLILGALALAAYFWFTGRQRLLKLANWRAAAGLLAIGVFAAAAFVTVRGGWGKGIVLAVIALWLAGTARWPRLGIVPARSGMSEAEARSILGVGEGAGPEEVKAAYARLIRRAHPDVGGTDGLAAQLNAARDRLLKGQKA